MGAEDYPLKRSDGRYDNIDFRKAVGHQFRPIKCAYNRRDVLLFVGGIPNGPAFVKMNDPIFSYFELRFTDV